ncbi:MAG: hypothetical protein V1800_15070 [Candidatus Latescibacterota bacterium]
MFSFPIRQTLLPAILLVGVLGLAGCAGTPKPAPESSKGVRIRVLFDPLAELRVAKIPVRLAPLPKGLRTAVCFGADVDGDEALEWAGLLQQYGWRGTLFFPGTLGEEADMADGILQIETLGMEVGCRILPAQLEDVADYAAKSKAFWDAFVAQPVVSLKVSGAIARKDRRQWAELGYLSVCSDQAVMALGPSSRKEPFVLPLLGPRAEIARRWIAVREQEGGLFYVWGRSDDTDVDRPLPEKLESILAEYGRMENVWYCTQGEWAAYLLLRDTSRIMRRKGDKKELCIELRPGRSVPGTWCPALTLEVEAPPSSVVMVMVDDRPVPFEAADNRVRFEVERIR